MCFNKANINKTSPVSPGQTVLCNELIIPNDILNTIYTLYIRVKGLMFINQFPNQISAYLVIEDIGISNPHN